MDYRRSVEPSPVLSSLSTQDVDYPTMSTLDAKDEYMSPALSFQHQTMMAQQSSATPFMLTSFISSQASQPWSLFPLPGTGLGTMTAPLPAPAYYDYRSAASVSAASDSGYASLPMSVPKPYMDDISSIGEETFDPEVQRISSQFGLVAFDRTDPREAEVPTANPTASGTKPRAKLQCEYCHEIVKTRSVLK